MVGGATRGPGGYTARHDDQRAERQEAPFHSMGMVYVIIPCRFHHLIRGMVLGET